MTIYLLYAHHRVLFSRSIQERAFTKLVEVNDSYSRNLVQNADIRWVKGNECSCRAIYFIVSYDQRTIRPTSTFWRLLVFRHIKPFHLSLLSAVLTVGSNCNCGVLNDRWYLALPIYKSKFRELFFWYSKTIGTSERIRRFNPEITFFGLIGTIINWFR